MASMEPESNSKQPKSWTFSARFPARDATAGEIEDPREPLIHGDGSGDSYSVAASILPFLFPAIGGLLYGYDIGATSGAKISLQSVTLSGTTWYGMSSIEVGLVVSGSLYGALIGSVLAYIIADFLGRRRELIISSILYFVGVLLTAVAPNLPIMVAGRFIFGIGIGLAMHAAPMYIAETTPSQIRGTLISLKEFFIVFGMLLGYITGNIYVDLVGGWRYMYATCAPICIVMGIGMWWLPPSPRWLLLCAIQGKRSVQDARELSITCLCRLRGSAFDSSASEQVDLILNDLSHANHGKQSTFREIFQGKCLKALIIGAGLVFFQQITGQPSVLYYAATILQSAGFSAASDATRVSILLGLLKLIMTGIAVLVVDRLGRRPLLISGVSGIACGGGDSTRNTGVRRRFHSGCKAKAEDVTGRVEAILEELRAARNEISALRNIVAILKASSLLNRAFVIGTSNIRVVVESMDEMDADALKNAAEFLVNSLKDPAVVVLGSCPGDGKVSLVATCTPSVVKMGIQAGKFIGGIAKLCGGGGGGKPNFAQAGGRKPENLQDALEKARTELIAALNGKASD